MRLRLAAFLAGYQPKKMPMAQEKVTEIRMLKGVMATFQCMVLPTTEVAAQPNKMPINPPKMLIVTASMTNWRSTSRL